MSGLYGLLQNTDVVPRWDTPQHVLVDDPDPDGEQIWPGKDYSNPRISDFHTLSKPHEDMYDRSKVARMPWYVYKFASFVWR